MYITGVDGDERDGGNKPGHYITHTPRLIRQQCSGRAYLPSTA